MTPLPAAPAENLGRAIALTLTTIAVFGVQDAVAKLLVQEYSPFQTTMMRYWGFSLFVLAIVWREGPLRQAFVSKMPKRQMLRGVLLMVDIWCFAIALQTVALGTLQSIVIVYPLLVTVFAIPILGEKVGVFRFAAVGAGMVGALVILRPGGVPLDWGVGFGIASACFYALYIVLTRQVSRVDSASVSLAYASAVGLLMSGAVGFFFWQPMDWFDFAMVVVTMITTCAGHGLMVFALTMAPASVLQPFNYFSLPWAIVLSIVVFNQWIDPVSLLGAGIIVAAGLVVMARERHKSIPAVAVAPVGKE